MFITLCTVLFILHSTSGYPPGNLQKFYNFDPTKRASRQVSSGGFEWESPNNLKIDVRQNSDLSDRLIFEDEFENRYKIPQKKPGRRRRPTTSRAPSSTVAVPGMGTTRTPCEDRCLTTPQYNPVCGDDNMTYFNHYRLLCAQNCGKQVKMMHMGACSRIPPRG